MGLVSRNLDDRDFNQLLAQAEAHLREKCPGWTDFSPGDPGRVMVELFAHLTDTLLYRLNRLPDKAYVEFLRLMGVQVAPPMAAQVTLRFSRKAAKVAAAAKPAPEPLSIPPGTGIAVGATVGPGAAPTPAAPPVPEHAGPAAAPPTIDDVDPLPDAPQARPDADPPVAITIGEGTRVTVEGSSGKDAPVFVTMATTVLAAGQDFVDVLAVHYEYVAAEKLGISDGTSGQSFKLRRPPALGAFSSGPALEVGVQTGRDDVKGAHSRPVGDKWFRIWREVPNFGEAGDDGFVYVADRMIGAITFAPAPTAFDDKGGPPAPNPLGEVPGAGLEIRAWYGRGGGPSGNVRAGTLTLLKEPIPGLDVTNPEAATGGSDAETLDNAIRRAPQSFYSLNRAVTVRDYELLVRRIGGGAIARTLVFAISDYWSYASPGTVQVLLVPAVSAPGAGPVTLDHLVKVQTPDLREKIENTLRPSVPLGTDVTVDWIAYRSVKIKAAVVAYPGEDREKITELILRRLNQMISPVATPPAPPWPFEQPLRIGRIYDAIYNVPGVKDAESVTMSVDEAPTDRITSLAADFFQRGAWYAASGGKLYRSLEDGLGWALLRSLETEADESIELVRAHLSRAGYVLAVSNQGRPGAQSYRVWVSFDCGNTFKPIASFDKPIRDAAWVLRGNDSVLLLAGDQGLFELSMVSKAVPQPLDLPGLRNVGCWSLAVTENVLGRTAQVAVATQNKSGVFLSPVATKWDFKRIPNLPAAPSGGEIRTVRWQQDGVRQYLWAGETFVGGDVPNRGPHRWSDPGQPPDQYPQWQIGSCYGLAVSGTRVFAATPNQGVLWLNTFGANPSWQHLDADCNLPRDPAGVLLPVNAVATAPPQAASDVVLAGTNQGVYRSRNAGLRYANVSALESTDTVLLPRTSLFVSGDHEISVTS